MKRRPRARVSASGGEGGGQGERGRGKFVLATDCTPHTCSFPSIPLSHIAILLQRPL